MRKFTLFNSSLLKKEKLVVTTGLMLLPIFGVSQTAEQIQKIKAESNLKELGKIENSFKKNTLSVLQLKTMAKEKNIKFSGEENGKYYQLVGFDKWTQAPLYYVTNNIDAASGTQTNQLHSSAGIFDLDGVDMIVHEWDGGGVLSSHVEFGGRVLQQDAPNGNSAHATHVAGTMIAAGVDAKAKGMAPEATLHAYDWNSDEEEMAAAAADGALVSNHSYGYVGGFSWGSWSGVTGWHWFGADEDTEYKFYGKYTTSDRNFDMIAVNAPYYLPVKAAGNDKGGGPTPGGAHYVRVPDGNGGYVWAASNKVRQQNGGENGYDIINQGSLGKNILTVGAAEKLANGYTNASDVRMASFSSTGPVDDGRIKPDIAGIGVGLYSSVSTGNNSYQEMSGTSMASPNVTGSLLLLQEHYKKENAGAFMRAATLKALIAATANEAGAHIGPDYDSGWGLLNAYKAALTISGNEKYAFVKENTLTNSNTDSFEVKATGTEPLKVTIAWTDPVPTDDMLPGADLNDRKAVLINDLDVRVTKDGETFLPWKLDPANPGNAATKGDNVVDNVEQVVIENPERGADYTITVSHKNPLKKNEFQDNGGVMVPSLLDADTQDYGLVVTGINAGIDIDLALTDVQAGVSPVEYSAQTPVEFNVVNNGLMAASNGKLKYRLLNQDNNNEVLDEGEIDLNTIDSFGTEMVTVSMDLSKPFTNYLIEGEVVVADDEIEANNKNQVVAVTYLVDLRPDDTSHFFGFEDNFNNNGWTLEDKDGDGKVWRKYDDANFAKTGESIALSFPDNNTGTNDWLFSNPVYVKANTKYRVIYNVAKFQLPEEKIAVYFGDQPNSDAMVNKLGEEVVELFGGLDKRYAKYAYEFEVAEDKVIYIGFNNLVADGVESYAIAVDDVTIERAEGEPILEFAADLLTPSTYETVSFNSSVIAPANDPATQYQWEFTPNDVSFENGTSASSQNPEVIFHQEAPYTVTFKATNGAGEGVVTRADYITPANVPVDADFAPSDSNIYEGETVTFTNISTGNPEPSEFEWTITPTEGVEYLTSTTEEDLVVKLNNVGTYSVKLIATSPYNSDEVEKVDVVTVESSHYPVQNLTGNLDDNSGVLELTWEKPVLLPVYEEEFTSAIELPADMHVYDNNNNGTTWEIASTAGVGGSAAARSYSWLGSAMDADDWLVTPKLRAGAEVLKYMTKYPYAERYDIYVVPAPASGNHPTVEEILSTGVVVYTNELEEPVSNYTTMSVDLTGNTEEAFFIAFHHRTKAEDDAFYLIVDNLMVGYNSTPYNSKAAASKETGLTALEEAKANPDRLSSIAAFKNLKAVKENTIINYGVLDLPKLEGYKVEKDDAEVKVITDINETTYLETLTDTGSFTYKVYAVYDDRPSEPVSITIDASSLATTDLEGGQALQVYPNPSNGKFVVEHEAGVTSFNAEVFNLAGQLIYQSSFTGNKAEINLTQYPAGVYVLNLVDNNGKQQSVKVIIK